MTKRITAVRAGRSGRVMVTLEGGERFPLGKTAAAGLQPGQTLPVEEIERLKQKGAADDAFTRCLGLLARRPRSRAEFERYLRGRKLGDAEIGAVLGRLAAHGWADDSKFSREWVENRQEFRPRSARALQLELRRKGVSAEDARAAVQGVRDEPAALAAARKKAPRLIRDAGKSPDGSRRFEQKMTAFLASRGFDYDLSRETARKVWEEHSRPGEAG